MSPRGQLLVLATFLGLLAGCGGGTGPLYTNDSLGTFGTSFTPTFQPPGGFGNSNGGNTATGEFPGDTDTTPAPAGMDPGLVDGGPPTSNPASNPASNPLSNRASDDRLAESVLEVISVLSGVGSSGAELGRVGDAIFSTGLRWRAAAPTAAASNAEIGLENTGLLRGLGRILLRLQQDPPPATVLGVGHEGGPFPGTGMRSYPCGEDGTDSTLGTGNPVTTGDSGRYEVQSFQAPEGAGFFLSGKVLTVQFYDCLLDGNRFNGGFNLSAFTVAEPPAQDGVYRKEIRGELSFNGLSVQRGSRGVELSTENGSRALLRVTFAGDGRVLSIRLDSGDLILGRAGNQDERLRNLVLLREAYLNGGGWTLEVSGALISSVTEARVEVETPEPLRWLPGENRPFSGILTIRHGATPLRITFFDAPS